MLIGILLSVSGMALAQSSPSKAITPQATQSRTVADAIPPDADRAAYAASELAHGKLAVRPDTPPLPSKGLTHYLVTLKPDADPHQWDQELSPTHHFSHALKGFRAQLTADQYKKLKNDKQVLAIEPDTAIRPAVVTGAANGQNPTPDSGCICEFEFSNVEELPTGLVRMGVPSFPLAHIDGGDHQLNVNVAVLDTGIDLGYSYADWYNTSPELNVAESIEFTTNVDTNGQPVYYYQGWDSIGHGTHVSGTIGARNNGYGVVGVAPGVTIYNYQVITPTSSAWGNVVQALDHVVANQSPSHNIQVINASLESTGPGAPYFAVSAAVRSVVNLGIVYVNAAGNDGCDIYGANCSWTGSGPTGPGSTNCVLPASVREALVVSAMDPTPTNSTYDTIASYSNYSGSVVDSDPAPDGSPPNPSVPVISPGKAIDVAAPGGMCCGIRSLYFGGEGAAMGGTSMATAHVSGLVALYLAANPAPATPDANWVYSVRQALINCGLPQSQWGVTNTFDPDGNPEPLAVVSESWIPQPNILSWSMTSGAVELKFLTIPGYTYTVQYNHRTSSASGLRREAGGRAESAPDA